MTRPLIVFLETYVAGGADRVVANVLPQLPPVPIELMINARCDPAILLGAPLPAHVEVHRYAWRTPAELAAWSRRASTRFGGLGRRAVSVALRYPLLALLWLRCRRWFRRRHPRAVWVSNGGYPGGDVCRVATIAAGALPDCTVVHLVHSVAQPPRRSLRWLERRIDRWLDRSARVIAVSGAVARSLRAQRAISQDPLVVPNGLPTGPHPSPPPCNGGLALLQVGYFDRNKNQAMAVRALGELRRASVRDVSLTFVGKEVDRGQLDAIRALAESEGVAGQIRYAGFLSDMDAAYAACDAVVVTSLVEGHPVSVLEAMRAGRAVVATPAGGVDELVEHGKTGWVLAGWDHSDLAAVWRRWLADPSELAAWGAHAYEEFVSRYRVKVQADQLAEILGLSVSSAEARR